MWRGTTSPMHTYTLTHWFYLRTSWPTYSNKRLIDSPIIVDRRCPTCISLAMLGEDISTSSPQMAAEHHASVHLLSVVTQTMAVSGH